MSDVEVSAPFGPIEEVSGGGGGILPGTLPGGRRFQKSPAWKHVIAARDPDNFRIVTDLTTLASNRSGRFELGGPSWMECHVPSHDFRVYFPTSDEFAPTGFDPFYVADVGFVDLPRVDEGVRLMYSFRRECPPDADPWVIRHAGPVLEIEDDGDPETGRTRFVAYDPWQYLYQRPIRRSSASPTVNPLPGGQGVVFASGVRGDEIVTELLRRSIEEDGLTYIDAGEDWGGTSFYQGVIEETAAFTDNVIFPTGSTVGQAWEQLVDTGTLDVVLTPIWDPLNRPGYCAELNVRNTAGADNTPDLTTGPYTGGWAGSANFRWDRTGGAMLRLNYTQDGKERANNIRAWAGGTGSADKYILPHRGTGDAEATVSDSGSVDRYGEAWLEQTYVRQTRQATALRQAQDELLRRRVGNRSWTFDPTPEFSPRPFQDYDIGTFVSFYHSKRLRREYWGFPAQLEDQEVFPRITSFSIAISDDSLETVTAIDIGVDDPPSDAITV